MSSLKKSHAKSLTPSAKSPSNSLPSFANFLRDKTYLIIVAIIVALIAGAFLIAFRVNPEMITALAVLWAVFLVVILAIEYFHRRSFYRQLLSNIEQLDQAYLVLETLTQPKFYDGAILYEALYQTNKSMLENIARYRTQAREFQDYAEMWIHEVKAPLATLSLMSRDPKINEQIKRMDDYVEQILYFARAENSERDYLIREVDLAEIVGAVAVRNREILQMSHIDLIVTDLDRTVFTDAKWLEFILGQIVNNSIKYGAREIRISATSTTDQTTLRIRDDGIGISPKDLPNVFKKSFTGRNGHRRSAAPDELASHRSSTSGKLASCSAASGKIASHRAVEGHQSTGMGLYLAHTLCQKLGVRLSIASEEGAWTEVELTFPRHDFYTGVKD